MAGLPLTCLLVKIRARPNFYMLSNNPNISLKVVDCSLFTRRRTFIIKSRQNPFIQKNIVNISPIRRIAVAIKTKSAVAGSLLENPFNYQQFVLR